jgi:cytochrome d ubiquinol oxidase subunit I
MGVVSGIVLSYQFGTNWSRFSVVIGNVVGPLIGYEVLTAFFLEATFLGILLFGWKRVPPWLHTLSAVLVAVGTLSSAFWIISANSWMQAPAGFELRDGIAYPTDWVAAIFNPTFPLRLAHMVTAAYLTTAFVVIAVGARYVLAGRDLVHARTMLKMGLGLAVVLAPLQLVIGDSHGLEALVRQPAKIAAVEAHWDGSKPGDLVLFAWPDERTETNLFELSIPKGASVILKRDPNGLFPGLKDFPIEDRPPVLLPFFGFRLMVGLGLVMIALAVWGVFLWWRGTLERSQFYLRLLSISWPAGFVAILAGWTVAEVGRQPWTATGILRTADSSSPVVAGAVLTTLILFVLVYGVVFSGGILYINRMINRGPGVEAPKEEAGVPSRPLSAAEASAQEIFGGGRQS